MIPRSFGPRVQDQIAPVVVPIATQFGTFAAHRRQRREQRVDVFGAEALHVHLSQVGVDVLGEVLVVGQLADTVVRGGQRRQDALVGDAIAIAPGRSEKAIL